MNGAKSCMKIILVFLKKILLLGKWAILGPKITYHHNLYIDPLLFFFFFFLICSIDDLEILHDENMPRGAAKFC